VAFAPSGLVLGALPKESICLPDWDKSRTGQPDGVMFGIDFRHAVEFSRSGRAPITGLSASSWGNPLTLPPHRSLVNSLLPGRAVTPVTSVGTEIWGVGRDRRALSGAAVDRTSVRVGTGEGRGQLRPVWSPPHAPAPRHRPPRCGACPCAPPTIVGRSGPRR